MSSNKRKIYNPRFVRTNSLINFLINDYKNTKDKVEALEQSRIFFDDLNISVSQQGKEINKFKENLNIAEEEVKNLKDLRNHIFSVMALFFGVFAFISVDIGVTKSLLSYFSAVDGNSENLIFFIIGALIVSQAVFFVCIYFCLLRPFLNKINEKCETTKIHYIKLGIIVASLLLSIFLIKENNSLKNNQSKLEKKLEMIVNNSTDKEQKTEQN